MEKWIIPSITKFVCFPIYLIKLCWISGMIKQFIFSERKWVSSEKQLQIVKEKEGVKCEGGEVCHKWDMDA
jgi:hypothetical protein